MLKISCTGCLGLFPVIPALFTLHMCVAAKNRKKITQTPYFWGSWSFKIIDVANSKSSSAVLVMISSKSVSICNRSHAGRTNGGKITIS